MKKLTLSLVALLSITAISSEIRSKKLRKLVCSEIISKEYSLDIDDCLAGSIGLMDLESFHYKGKDHTALMNINSKFKGSLFQLELSRSVIFQHSGIKFSAWDINLMNKEYGNEAILLKTDRDDSNSFLVKKLRQLPEGVKNWDEIEEYKSDYSETEISFYTVKNASGKKLGYIVHLFYADEEADSKGYIEQTFDLEGNPIGSASTESFGYHE